MIPVLGAVVVGVVVGVGVAVLVCAWDICWSAMTVAITTTTIPIINASVGPRIGGNFRVFLMARRLVQFKTAEGGACLK